MPNHTNSFRLEQLNSSCQPKRSNWILCVLYYFLLSIFLLETSHAAVYIITTQRPAIELIQALQPHVGDNGHVQAADGFKLIVRADETAMETVRTLLETLDRPPKLLKIELSFGHSKHKAARNFNVDIPTQSSTRRITSETRGNIKAYTTDSARNSEHSVIVAEGEQAWVQSGVSQPYRSSNLFGSTTTFKEVRQGFYVTPRLTGSKVHLSISTQNNQAMKHNNQTIEVNEVKTVVIANLDQWTPIAQGKNSSQRNAQGWVYRTERRASRDREVYIRVSLADP